jgi:hypothetical protein
MASFVIPGDGLSKPETGAAAFFNAAPVFLVEGPGCRFAHYRQGAM